MIIKIHSRGIGAGRGPVDYLLGKDRDRPDARLDRGDPEQMIQLIDSSNYAQKYTSGVLSFAERDLDERQKQQIMDSFERTLLPGLDKDQYSVLWVQHQDKDRLELNFVVANVELQSGKRLQPYYDRADRPRLNAWKDLVNDHYKLHDPNDPLNKRELCTPNNLPRTKKEASETITNGLLGLAEQGRINNRDDVVKTLEGAGFEIARTTGKSISIKDPDGGQNIRLKGMIYEQNFRFGQELRADIERASQSYRADRNNRVQEARTTLDRLTERKRENNQQRYPRTERTDTPDYVKNLEYRSDSHRYGYRPSMGDFGISEPQNQGKRRPDSSSERHDTEIDRRRGQLDHNQLPRQQEPQTLVHQDEYTGRQLARGLSRPNGVLNHDRVGTAATQGTGTDAERTTDTAERFTADVREYQARQSGTQAEFSRIFGRFDRNRQEQEREFEQISKADQQLEQTSTELQRANRHLEQANASARTASIEAQKMNEPERSYSSGFGLMR